MDYLQALKLVLNEADNALDNETSLANSVLLKTAIEKVEHNYNSEATKHNEQIEPDAKISESEIKNVYYWVKKINACFRN